MIVRRMSEQIVHYAGRRHARGVIVHAKERTVTPVGFGIPVILMATVPSLAAPCTIYRAIA
jgi:hypothetical protein